MEHYPRSVQMRVILLILFTLTNKVIFSQNIDFCGTFPFQQASSTNPDSICWDRFGNSYDIYANLPSGSDLSLNCQNGTGYYQLVFGNGINQDLKNVFCQVFSDLSDSIQQRVNIVGCGDTIQPSIVRIEIRIKPLAMSGNDTVLMAASSLFTFPFNYYCYPLGVSFVERKINGSKNHSPFITDGFIYINEGIQNRLYTKLTETPPNPGSKYDAYTVILHEALHLLGYSSFMWLVHPDSLKGFSKWDKNIYTTFYYGIPSQVTAVIEGDCQHNCWELNDELFPDEDDLLDAIVNNCSIGGNLDFIYGNPVLAPISGRNNNNPPTTNAELSNLLSHFTAVQNV